MLILLLLLSATAQPLARDTFDPAVHAIGRMRGGGLELLVDGRVLVRSLQVRLPDLADHGWSIDRQVIGEADFLVVAGWLRAATYRRYLVAVRLRYDADGYAFADRLVKICTARDDTVCSDCVLTTAGCRCWTDETAFCGSTAGDEMIFSKVAVEKSEIGN